MSEPPYEPRSRMDTLAPGVPVEAKAALLLGLAGGLFAAIVVSYVDADRQYLALGIGIGIGIAAAIGLTVRSHRKTRTTD